ncbi:acyl carrier protein [Cellulomonas palmilytica]|uniref:acyl carrier protein n=1 Tax=Cellulomonas palmilytica TaxID=2608402 RepID=UPI001F2FC0A9|nr:acyl carrier protein [Cellulomonas palmilytica]UJP40683.1 acyl carrier protein [Cellulomonas palmilytica]
MSTETSEVLVQVAQALRAPVVRPEDNFYELGGDSLAALEVAEILEQAFGRPVDERLVLESATFADLLSALDDA